MKLYAYKNCDTCRKAKKWLDARGLEYEEIPIRESPPTPKELKTMLGHVGAIKRLFNTSGQDYRKLGIKDQLPGMSEGDAFALLSNNGNLVKRPFLLGDHVGLVGFKEEAWTEALT